jgi:hypothetical protein
MEDRLVNRWLPLLGLLVLIALAAVHLWGVTGVMFGSKTQSTMPIVFTPREN